MSGAALAFLLIVVVSHENRAEQASLLLVRFEKNALDSFDFNPLRLTKPVVGLFLYFRSSNWNFLKLLLYILE